MYNSLKKIKKKHKKIKMSKKIKNVSICNAKELYEF